MYYSDLKILQQLRANVRVALGDWLRGDLDVDYYRVEDNSVLIEVSRGDVQVTQTGNAGTDKQRTYTNKVKCRNMVQRSLTELNVVSVTLSPGAADWEVELVKERFPQADVYTGNEQVISRSAHGSTGRGSTGRGLPSKEK